MKKPIEKILSTLIAICLVTVSLPIVAVMATSPSSTPPEAESSTTAVPFDFTEPIRVGYYPAYIDMVSDIDSLNNKGYGYEIFEKMSERSELEFEFVPIYDSMLQAVESGYVDVGGFNTKSDAREERVLYSQSPYTKTHIALMSKDESISYADYSAIDGKTVGVYDENIGIEKLDEICELNDITVEYVYADSSKYIDLDTDFHIVYSEDPAVTEMNNVLTLGVHHLYLISGHENVDLMETLDANFFEIVYSEGNFFLELEEKYFSEYINMSHRRLTNEELEILTQRPLEVGYVDGFSPMSYTNDQGEADGALHEMFDYLSNLYGFEVNYHPYNLDDPQETLQNFDVLLTLYRIEGDGNYESEYFEATDAFYEIPMYTIMDSELMENTPRSEALNSGVKIGSLPYQTIDFPSFTSAFPNSEVVFYTVWHDLLDDLAAGNVDMLLCTESATTYTEIYFEDVDTASLMTDAVSHLQFLINKNITDEYLPIFNVLTESMSVREYEAIIETSANAALPETTTGFWEFLAENWYYFALSFFITIAGFIAIYYKGQINKKEALLASYNTDQLTGLTAIQKFRQTVDETIEKAQPGQYELISFDIDMFKTINTHFSADRGTALIIAIAEALKDVFKGTDVLVSRRTSDQFLILRRVNEGGDMRQLFNKAILPAIEDNITDKYKVTLSFGNVVLSDVRIKASALIGQADNARMAGKSSHKTTFITFDDEMRKLYDNKINITFRMEQALKDREFVVEFQPKTDFKTLKIGGAEALVRWVPRFAEKIYPDEFIPVFEENGFISYLDLYVLEEVCRFIKEHTGRHEIPRIAVNLSAHTVLADNIVSRVSEILSQYNIDPKRIELELTESAVEANTDRFLTTIKRFKALGFIIAIDDFGAGVSSLNRLSAVEADTLKLDKAFFDQSEKMGKSMIVVADVIRMAKRLNMKVVAEGVETSAQATWLKGIGCDYAQGYYFARPMSLEAFRELLDEKKQYSLSLTGS